MAMSLNRPVEQAFTTLKQLQGKHGITDVRLTENAEGQRWKATLQTSWPLLPTGLLTVDAIASSKKLAKRRASQRTLELLGPLIEGTGSLATIPAAVTVPEDLTPPLTRGQLRILHAANAHHELLKVLATIEPRGLEDIVFVSLDVEVWDGRRGGNICRKGSEDHLKKDPARLSVRDQHVEYREKDHTGLAEEQGLLFGLKDEPDEKAGAPRGNSGGSSYYANRRDEDHIWGTEKANTGAEGSRQAMKRYVVSATSQAGGANDTSSTRTLEYQMEGRDGVSGIGKDEVKQGGEGSDDIQPSEALHHPVGEGSLLLEIGTAVLSTKVSRRIIAHHIIVEEHFGLKNTFVPDNKERFYGESQVLPLAKVGGVVRALFKRARHFGKRLILVGHSVEGDIAWLKERNIDLAGIQTLDVAEVWMSRSNVWQKTRLSHMATHYNLEPEALHNAGNDSVITLAVLICMLADEGSKAVDRPTAREARDPLEFL